MAETTKRGAGPGAPLTDRLARSLTFTVSRSVYDGGTNRQSGFGVRVGQTRKSWILGYTTASGRERRMTIGDFPAWSAPHARRRAAKLPRQLTAAPIRSATPRPSANRQRSATCSINTSTTSGRENGAGDRIAALPRDRFGRAGAIAKPPRSPGSSCASCTARLPRSARRRGQIACWRSPRRFSALRSTRK
jgi:hypothetical protein